MNVAGLRRRLRERLDDLSPARSEASSAGREPYADPNTRSPSDAARAVGETPRLAPRVPGAIAHDLKQGLGWPRQTKRRALPTKGPLLPPSR